MNPVENAVIDGRNRRRNSRSVISKCMIGSLRSWVRPSSARPHPVCNGRSASTSATLLITSASGPNDSPAPAPTHRSPR